MNELELAAKPQRKRFEAEVEKTKQRAFERGFKETAKQVAAAEGAKAGAAAAGQASADPIVEAARQRALAGGNSSRPTATPERAGLDRQARATPQLSGEFIKRPDGSRVPKEYFDLPREQQENFDSLLKQKQADEEGESRFDLTALALLDQQAAMASRLTALERRDAEKDAVILGLVRLIDQQSTVIEIAKSDALAEQQVTIAQQTVNLQAIGAEQESNHQRRIAEAAQQAADHEARMVALEEPMATFEGRLKGASTLYQEGIIANQGQLASVGSEVQQLRVEVAELKGQADAIGNPITRPEMKAMVTTEVTAEVKAQAPDLIDQQIQEDKELGVINPGGQTLDRAFAKQKRDDAQAFRANATRGR